MRSTSRVAVLADPAVLATLPDREYRCGLGEVVKYALLGDDALQALSATRADAVLARDPEVLREVDRAVRGGQGGRRCRRRVRTHRACERR